MLKAEGISSMTFFQAFLPQLFPIAIERLQFPKIEKLNFNRFCLKLAANKKNESIFTI